MQFNLIWQDQRGNCLAHSLKHCLYSGEQVNKISLAQKKKGKFEKRYSQTWHPFFICTSYFILYSAHKQASKQKKMENKKWNVFYVKYIIL